MISLIITSTIFNIKVNIRKGQKVKVCTVTYKFTQILAYKINILYGILGI